MLRAKKVLQTLARHSADLTYSQMLRRCELRLCYSQKMDLQKFQFSTVHKLINLREDAIQEKEMDPRVEKWKDKLLYSDYVLSKSLKFGYRMNKRIEDEMQRKVAIKESNELMNTPTRSIALKYLDDNQNLDYGEENFDNTSTEIEEEAPMPIYMPYAAKDSFEKVELPQIQVEKEDASVLNENFKSLYEKYLKAQENPENSEELKGKLRVRLGDDLSKVPSTWMTDYETFDDVFKEESWKSRYGTPVPNSKVSSVSCGGCGALLHCKDPEIPGFLPSELFLNRNKNDLRSLNCQRCHFMKFYNTSLDVKVSPEQYPELLQVIKEKKCAVILMVDLTDFPSTIWPDINSIIGRRTPIFLVGNKIDLLPQDSTTFFQHVKDCLFNAVLQMGVNEKNIKSIELISAKSGFGIEEFITKLQNLWQFKGDVYLVGCTNVGKSSLFNTLIQSDYCKVQAIDLMHRATTSPWPGTTLNLLKFPITNPLRWRLYTRTKRLLEEKKVKILSEKLRRHQFNVSKNIVFATLQGRIGRSYRVPTKEEPRENFSMGSHKVMSRKKFGINEKSEVFRQSKWCFDTPGTIQPDQILHLLTTDELMKTLPNQIISPRTFVMKEGQTLFLAGLGRIDFSKVPSYLRCTVFASDELPITICETIYADEIYRELLLTEAFVVPLNNPERLKLWPELLSKEMKVTGISQEESVSDVILSSAGWVSVTPVEKEEVTMSAWTPEGRGLFLRTPALLRYSVNLRGPRVKDCPAYKKGKRVYTKAVHF